MSMKIYSWNQGDGSKLLAEALDIYRIKHNNSRYRPRRGDILINWGCPNLPDDYNIMNVWNLSRCVDNVINKKTFFRLFEQDKGFDVPPFFFDRDSAVRYLNENPGSTLVCRTILRGHEGRGIVLATEPNVVPDCQLYTAYVKKKAEYRVHVAFGEVIDAVQKKRKAGSTGDTRIRNTANGYIFARNNIDVPDSVLSSAVNAVKHYGLDFGAVDIIWNERQAKAYVLEINTAPGIEGTTVTRYAEAFKKAAE